MGICLMWLNFLGLEEVWVLHGFTGTLTRDFWLISVHDLVKFGHKFWETMKIKSYFRVRMPAKCWGGNRRMTGEAQP